MTALFLDTVSLVALWNKDDQWHQAAEAAYQSLLTAGRDSVSTSYVLAEFGNAASRRSFRPGLEHLRKSLEAAGRLIFPTVTDWQEAWAAFNRYEGNSAGLVDCISFVVMRRLGIRQVFSNDQHFQAAGFE